MYRNLRIKGKKNIINASSKSILNSGLWVPVSVAAYLSNVSAQSIRLKIFKNEISACQFPAGPVLVNLNDVTK